MAVLYNEAKTKTITEGGLNKVLGEKLKEMNPTIHCTKLFEPKIFDVVSSSFELNIEP